MFNNLLSIFIGGGIGAILRYIITISCTNLLGLSFLGTFTANMTGCFLIGLVFGLTIHKIEALPDIVKLFIITGFLGGLTTFSTFSLEVIKFLMDGRFLIGILILFCNCIIGLILTLTGIYLSKFL